MPETKLGESKSNIIRQVSFKDTAKLIVFSLSFRRNLTSKSVSFKVSSNGIFQSSNFVTVSFLRPVQTKDQSGASTGAHAVASIHLHLAIVSRARGALALPRTSRLPLGYRTLFYIIFLTFDF